MKAAEEQLKDETPKATSGLEQRLEAVEAQLRAMQKAELVMAADQWPAFASDMMAAIERQIGLSPGTIAEEIRAMRRSRGP